MSNEIQLIRSISNPTIKLDDIIIPDSWEGTSSDNRNIENQKGYKMYGDSFPLIKINDYIFTSEQIIRIEINNSEYIPTINATLLISQKLFYTTSYPKDGDIISIFIRSGNKLLKPIRNDFEIISVTTNLSRGGNELTYEKISIYGILHIPGILNQKCFSVNGTSLEAMLEISNKLGLGFATNETSTDDYQRWICPYSKTIDFIYDISLSSWKNTESFFTFFVDTYYYLNFVNINPLFLDLEESELGIMTDELFSTDYTSDDEKALYKGNVILTNFSHFENSEIFIRNYRLENNSYISNKYGQKINLMFYDTMEQETEKMSIETLITNGKEDNHIILKGRPNENYYLEQTKTKWNGVIIDDNVHDMYKISKMNNFHNNNQINKLLLNVEMSRINFNLRRMQPVMLLIFVVDDTQRKEFNMPQSIKNQYKDDEMPFSIDQFFSGCYVIKDIKYRYDRKDKDNGKFYQTMTLMRREWPNPKILVNQ